MLLQYLKKADPRNYHPISLTSVVCKTMEHILVSQIMKHLEDQNILSENQFGFTPVSLNYSLPLMILLNTWTTTIKLMLQY